MQDYLAKVNKLILLTANTAELELDLIAPDKIDFQAGQFMHFSIGNLFRSYSITSVPQQNKILRFCIELLPQGGVGTNFVKSLKLGDQVSLRGPLGIFTSKNFEHNVFFVATGVGVAPFVSRIPDMLARGFAHQIHLLFGLRHEQDIFYFDMFRHLASQYPNFIFTPTLSKPHGNWLGETGRVTSYLDVHYEKYKDDIFYICGGTEMVKDVRNLLIGRGHHPLNIKIEIFE